MATHLSPTEGWCSKTGREGGLAKRQVALERVEEAGVPSVPQPLRRYTEVMDQQGVPTPWFLGVDAGWP